MVKVGCCGFPTSMKKYFESFSLVELNSTFYQYPRMETVEGWREKASEDFEFSVKAHQDISHKAKMEIDDVSLQAFERMKQICKALNSKILLIQTPGSFRSDRLGEAEKFFREVDREGLILVWETRGPYWETTETYRKLGRVLEELNVTHVTDPFRLMPAYVSEIVYFRLHGLGKQMYYYQYTDEELRKLKEFALLYEREGKDVYVLFNNLSMFEDGMRFMKYLSNGAFPKITKLSGLASILEVIEKTRYPIAKSTLIKRFGWRIVELEEGKQVRLETVLAKLSSKSFSSADKLVEEIKSVKKIVT